MNYEQYALERLLARPGQGSLIEQTDKILREGQRIKLFEMMREVDSDEADSSAVEIYKVIPQIPMKVPALVRFYLPKWKGFNDVFWRALGDYLILALHSVTDVDFDKGRGALKIRYFYAEDSRKTPEDVKRVIQKIVSLIENRKLPTDFTLFRRMDERSSTVGELSKKEAAVIGGIIEGVKLLV